MRAIFSLRPLGLLLAQLQFFLHFPYEKEKKTIKWWWQASLGPLDTIKDRPSSMVFFFFILKMGFSWPWRERKETNRRWHQRKERERSVPPLVSFFSSRARPHDPFFSFSWKRTTKKRTNGSWVMSCCQENHVGPFKRKKKTIVGPLISSFLSLLGPQLIVFFLSFGPTLHFLKRKIK